MQLRSRILLSVGFTTLLVALGASDAFLTKGTMKFPSPLTAQVAPMANTGPSAGIVRHNGPSVESILQAQSLALLPASQQSLLSRIVKDPSQVRTVALLKDDTRIALFSWMETSNAKTYFTALKDALHSSFSSAIQDLRDEMELSSTRPARNILTFKDPAIDPERIVLLRIRQRLFELHVTDGKNADVDALVEALSQ
jgi:hypothetical protein